LVIVGTLSSSLASGVAVSAATAQIVVIVVAEVVEA
jgi:hypothetical protein